MTGKRGFDGYGPFKTPALTERVNNLEKRIARLEKFVKTKKVGDESPTGILRDGKTERAAHKGGRLA